MFNRKLIKTLKATINSLENDLENEKQKNSYLTKDLVVMIQNQTRSRKRIIDLENNIEFLTNNIGSRKLKELVQPSHQN